MVLTQLPLKALLQRLNYTGRIAKLGTMLGAFDIKYLPRTAIKGQVLVNLVAEIIEGTEETVIKKREVSSLDVLVISTPCPPS